MLRNTILLASVLASLSLASMIPIDPSASLASTVPLVPMSSLASTIPIDPMSSLTSTVPIVPMLSIASFERPRESVAEAGTLDSPVVGGTTVKLGTWPDAVAVLTGDGGLCSGTLLEADLVLTAGHCTEAGPVRVVVGSVDLGEPGGQVRAVKWSKSYPRWESTYDVGVVMLENPVATKPRAIAAGCSTRKELARGTMLEVVGFGLTTKTGLGDNTRLHQGKIGVTDPDCADEPACEANVAPGGEFVAGGHGTDACFGDSGGPVYVTTASGPALIGVVSRGIASYGHPCGDGGVYVRADKVVDWIEKTTGRRVHRVACELPADAADDGTENPADEGGGCNAGGEAVGGALILVVLAVLWLLSWRGARRS